MKNNNSLDNQQPIFQQTRCITETDVYLVGDIGEPSEYVNIFQLLKDAREGDVIRFYINSVGGYLSTALQLISCMRTTEATTEAHIEGECHSAATLIFLSADKWVVNPNAIFLIHNYSGGAIGKGADLIKQVKATHTWATQLMSDTYQGFLKEEEINSLKNNEDLWLTTDQILERLELLQEYRESIRQEAEKEARDEVKKQLKEFLEESPDVTDDVTEDSTGVQEVSE